MEFLFGMATGIIIALFMVYGWIVWAMAAAENTAFVPNPHGENTPHDAVK